MGLQIEDGHGSGKSMQIDSRGRASVLAIVETIDERINQESEKVWSVPFEGINPAGADDYIVYIKNTGDKILHIADIRISADTAATQVGVHYVTGTAGGSLTTITPVPRTVGSSVSPTATIQSSADITGLTTGGTLYFIQCAVVNTEYHLKTSSKVRIPKGKAIALLVETGTANITGTISLVEEE